MTGLHQGRTAWLGVVLAASLTSLGWLWQTTSSPQRDDEHHSRVMVVGVRGVSWQTLLDLDAGQRLPGFRALLEGESSSADIISFGYGDPGEVLASVVTGKLTHKHGVRSFAQAARFRSPSRSSHGALWELIARRGQAVGVVGFPFWAPLEQPGSWVVPEWATFSESFLLYRNGREIPLPSEWWASIVDPAEVPSRLVDRVTGGGALPSDLTGRLRESLAADLTMIAIAREIYRESPETHVFLYLEGLEHWRSSLAVLRPETTSRLVSGYHVLVDELVARLEALDDGSTTFLLFSEDGNRGEAITHRPRFPELDAWPPVGWLVAWGRGVQRGVDPLIVSPVDLAATLLYVTGNPVPNDLDGVILFGLLHDDYFHKHRVRFAPAS